jgi:hypothetical protein
MGGVPRPLAAFWLSYPLIHDSSGLVPTSRGVCERSLSSGSSISLVESRGLRPLKPVALPVFFEVIGIPPPAPSFLLLLDICGWGLCRMFEIIYQARLRVV